MEAKDLRIGNLINWNGVDRELSSTLMNILLTNPNAKDYIKQVPLARELLRRFGFKQYEYTSNYKIKANKYWSLGELKQGFLKIKLTEAMNYRVENFGNKSIYLYTAHELQNLYFAITNTELELK